jgi:Polyketide cyclase / dehydrase and lipid transport
MTVTNSATAPLFQLRVETLVARTPEQVYAVVTDLGRSGEWSSECRGGKWISGEPATVGAVFRGENFRAPQVVAWAPVVRGDWSTESEVVTAEPGRCFAWAMRNKAGHKQESVWAFDIEPAPEGSLLVHRFWMGEATEGIQGITSGMSQEDRQLFFTEWNAKLERELGETMRRLKEVLERQ